MKQTILSLSLFSVLFSGTTLSAPVANLKIAGDIKPPTCTVNGASNEGDVEFKYAPLSPSMIPMAAEYTLPSQTQSLNLVCDAATYLTFTMSDVYPMGSYINQYTATRHQGVYGLVDKMSGKEIGGISYIPRNASVDGQSMFISQAGTSNWNDNLTKDMIAGWTKTKQGKVSTASELNLAVGKQFMMDIEVYHSDKPGYSFIKSQQTLKADGVDITEGLDFVGQAIMTFNFGV